MTAGRRLAAILAAGRVSPYGLEQSQGVDDRAPRDH